MATDSYQYISDLDTSKNSCEIKVRILRLWESKFTMDMILMDEKCEKIHATVKEVLIPSFRDRLSQGDVVMLSNFGVGTNNGRYPVLKHKYKLNFYRSTVVRSVVSFDGPIHGFKFVPFTDVVNYNEDDAIPVDIIGRIVECGNMVEYKKENNSEGKRITMELENLDGVTMRCTLWDDYAHHVHNFVVENKFEQLVVIIVQFGRVKKDFNGVLSVQNSLFRTKLYIDDADVQEIIDFKRMFKLKAGNGESSQLGSQLSSQRVNPARDEFLTTTKRMAIDEIVDALEPLVCIVLATITSLEEKNGWFYIACRKCRKKVVKKRDFVDLEGIDAKCEKNDGEDGRLFCPKCKAVTPVIPSFKLQVRVQDQSGATSFTMFDREVAKLLNKTATELRDKQLQAGDSETTFPDDLQSLIGKRLLFKVTVTSEDIDKGYQVYTVSKVNNDPNLMADFLKINPDDGLDVQDNEQSDMKKPDDSDNGCFPNKDVVSCTGDSSNALVVESETAESPLKRTLEEAVDKETGVEGSSNKRKMLKAVKIEKP